MNARGLAPPARAGSSSSPSASPPSLPTATRSTVLDTACLVASAGKTLSGISTSTRLFTQYGMAFFDEFQVYAGGGYAVLELARPSGSVDFEEHGRARIVGRSAAR